MEAYIETIIALVFVFIAVSVIAVGFGYVEAFISGIGQC